MITEMNKTGFAIIFLFLPSLTCLFAQTPSHAVSGTSTSSDSQVSSSNNLRGISASPGTGSGMKFTQNMGQIVDLRQRLRTDVLFKGEGGGADVYLRNTGISYVLSNIAEVIHDVDIQVELIGNADPIASNKLREEF